MYRACDVHSKIVLCFIIHSLFAVNVLCIICKNCRAVENPKVRCEPDCTGDICGLWEWEDRATFQLIQGCITGLDSKAIRMGCRKNTVGATLCLCNTYDGCNDIERPDMIALMRLINLPDLQCSDRIEAPYTGAQSSSGVCRSNYCFYTKSTNIGINGVVEETVTAGCGQLQQYIFDVNIYPYWPSAGLFSGGCYRLEDEINQLTVGCICHHNNFCNRGIPFPVAVGDVKCHVSYHTDNLTELENGTCTGHFCRIQKINYSSFGIRYTKGCVNVNDTMADVKLDVGYINIFGHEQWYCNEDYCNSDIETAQQTIQRKLLARISSVPPINLSVTFILLSVILLVFIC